MLVDPTKPYNFKRTPEELYLWLVFCAMVAGKAALPTAAKLTDLMTYTPQLRYNNMTSHQVIEAEIVDMLRACRTGKYTLLSRFFKCLNRYMHNYTGRLPSILHLWDRQSMMCIPGIGLKSASMFLTYTSKDSCHAVLDTHILKYLRDVGCAGVPDASPQSCPVYSTLERVFLSRARLLGVRPWVLDIFLWNQYRTGLAWDEDAFRSHVNDLEGKPEYHGLVRSTR